MCIDTVSLPNVSRYDNISIYRYISNMQSTIPGVKVGGRGRSGIIGECTL